MLSIRFRGVWGGGPPAGASAAALYLVLHRRRIPGSSLELLHRNFAATAKSHSGRETW